MHMVAIESIKTSNEKPTSAALEFVNNIESDLYDGTSPYVLGVRSVLGGSVTSRINDEDKELFEIGVSLGKSLIDLGWNKDRKTEENAKLIYSQRGYEGQIYYKSQSLLIISGILHNKSYLEVVDEISQNKSPGITEIEYNQIKEQVGIKAVNKAEVLASSKLRTA